MSGAQYSGQCFASAADAALAAYSSVPPVVGQAGTLYLVEQSGGAWFLNSYESGSLAASYAVPAPAFAPCDPASVLVDGIETGWLVASVLLAAYLMLQLKRSAR